MTDRTDGQKPIFVQGVNKRDAKQNVLTFITRSSVIFSDFIANKSKNKMCYICMHTIFTQ